MTHPGRHGAANADHRDIKNIPYIDGYLVRCHRRITERRDEQGDCRKHARLQKEGEADRKTDRPGISAIRLQSGPSKPAIRKIRLDRAGCQDVK
jgi:hypothetical protein